MTLLNRLIEALPLTEYVTDYVALADLAAEAEMTAKEVVELFAMVDGTNTEEAWSVYDKLYEMYWQDMPYGTAKARDGDPNEWISEKLFADFVTVKNGN